MSTRKIVIGLAILLGPLLAFYLLGFPKRTYLIAVILGLIGFVGRDVVRDEREWRRANKDKKDTARE